MEKTSKGAFTYNPDILKKGSVIKFSMGGLYKGHAYFRVMGFNGDYAKLLHLSDETDSTATGQYKYSGVWPTQGTTDGVNPYRLPVLVGQSFTSSSNMLDDITYKDPTTGRIYYNGRACGFDTNPSNEYGPIRSSRIGINALYNGLHSKLKDKILMTNINGVRVFATDSDALYEPKPAIATLKIRASSSLTASILDYGRVVPSSFTGLGVAPLTLDDITSYFGTTALKGEDIATKLFDVSKTGRPQEGNLLITHYQSNQGNLENNPLDLWVGEYTDGDYEAIISGGNLGYYFTMWLDLSKTRNYWEVDESYPGLE